MGDGTLRSDLKQALTAITYARNIRKNLSLGASFLIGLQTLNLRGAQTLAVFSNYPTFVSGKGTDYSIGAGFKLGVLYQLLDNLDLSASYQPKVWMTKLSFYKGLLPDGGSFDIPPFGNLGIAWHITPDLVLAGDVEKIWYKDIPAYGNNHVAVGTTCAPNTPSDVCYGGKNGPGFNWNNGIIYKIGAQWRVLPKTILRAGYNHTNQIMDSTYATENLITAGALIRNLFTIGLTQVISQNDNLNFMMVFIPKQTFNSTNSFSGTTPLQTVSQSASGIGFGFSWSRILS